MKVLLINPTYPFEESPTPPFGLMSLAAYLLDHNIEVRIEDYIITPYSKKRIKKVIDEYRPDVIGGTGVTMNIKTSLNVLKDCRDIDPDVIIVMGGPHVTFDADNILSQNQHIDYIIRGEGEITFLDFLEKTGTGRSISDVEGLSYRENGQVRHNKNRPLIEDINILPYPARHLVQLSKYRALGMPINMTTSRGCPYKCIFCVGSRMVGKKVRNYDVKRVVDEFEMLSKMGFKQINIVDDLFTANKNRCIAICDEILRRGIKHKWNAFSRVDTVSRDLLEKLKEAGCTTLCFGIESGNQGILNTAKKKTTIEKCRKAISLCNETGMEPMGSYILGLPGETPETVKQSLEFAKGLCRNYGFHILSPFPGTEVREKSGEYGIKILTDDWDKYDANQAICETDFISHKEINAIADGFNTSFRNYVDAIFDRGKKGEKLCEEDISFIENVTAFSFSKDLITDELIESFPGFTNGSGKDAIVEDLTAYIVRKTKYSGEEARKRLSRLLDMNCIKVESKGADKTVAWT